MPDPYILLLTGFGFLIAFVAWLPLVLKRLPLSLPILCLGLGAIGFLLPGVTLRPMPIDFPEIAERATEFVVIIALMGAGLKIDRPFGWRRWRVTWRLLAVTMPLSIAAIMLLGVYGLGLSMVGALLLGASLAPTDPVLAADARCDQLAEVPAVARRCQVHPRPHPGVHQTRTQRGNLLTIPTTCA